MKIFDFLVKIAIFEAFLFRSIDSRHALLPETNAWSPDLAALDEASLKGDFLAGVEVTIGDVVLGAGGSCGFATNFPLVEAKVQNLSFSVKSERCVALISEQG